MPFVPQVVGKGFLPVELPPPFNSRSFGLFAQNNPAYIADTWKSYVTQMVTHRMVNASGKRRKLSIPNPINYLRLAMIIDNDFGTVFKAAQSSPFAVSKPAYKWYSSRPILPIRNYSAISDGRVRARTFATHVQLTDVSRYYPSCYTHSIPWALHTKAVAKKNRGSGLTGNQIDKAVREAQDGQTLGIPIGPDLSMLIGELLLCAVDNASGLGGESVRWFDDYEIGGTSAGHCESLLLRLEAALHQYELELNSQKTKCIPLPAPIGETWVRALHDFKFEHGIFGTNEDSLTDFLDSAFGLAPENQSRAVLRYAIRKLHAVEVSQFNWLTLQRLVFHCASHEPQTLPHVIGLMARHAVAGRPVDCAMAAQLFTNVVNSYAPRGVGSEVAWAIWGFLQFNIQIPDVVATSAASLLDDVVCLLLLDARSRGLIGAGVSFANMDSVVRKDAFTGEHWLLAYEGVLKNWLTPLAASRTAFLADAHVAALSMAGVEFYDLNWTLDASCRHNYGTPYWLWDKEPVPNPDVQ